MDFICVWKIQCWIEQLYRPHTTTRSLRFFFFSLLYLNNTFRCGVYKYVNGVCSGCLIVYLCVSSVSSRPFEYFTIWDCGNNKFLVWGPLLRIRKNTAVQFVRKKTHWEFNDSTGSRIVIYNWPIVAWPHSSLTTSQFFLCRI